MASARRLPLPLPRNLVSPFPPLAEVPGYVSSALASLARGTVAGVSWFASYVSGAIALAVRDPAKARANARALWEDIKHELHHYRVGTKLLGKELYIAGGLVKRVGRGERLSRRERMQLKRTLADILRMVPFIIIVIVPLAEFALPVLLKVFPNMLPSQFEVCACMSTERCLASRRGLEL